MKNGKRIGIIGWILVACTAAFALTQYRSLQDLYVAKGTGEFKRQPLGPETLLTEFDVAHLPTPVRKYLAYTGALGQSKLQNVRIEFAAEMIRKPKEAPMHASSVQYNFFGSPARFFYMRASMFGLPFRVLHVYADQEATMTVRVLSLFNLVNLAGEQLSKAETVTVLNDMCLLAPASLVDPRLTWKELDPQSARVTFHNGPYQVAAVLYFNPAGELVNFISDDRSALLDDGTLRTARWSTPVRDYRDFAGRKVPGYGEAIWNYPEGDFTYGRFTLKDIRYNVKEFEEK